MRISDWSSDVCSSDLIVTMLIGLIETGLLLTAQGMLDAAATSAARVGSTNYKPTGTARETYLRNYVADKAFGLLNPAQLQVKPTKSEARRVGQEGGSTCISRGWWY